MCASLDAEVEAFRARPLGDTGIPYLWLDATYLKVREAGRVVSMACLVATGVAMTGERRVLGLELSPGNDEGSAWPRFIRSLCERGLHGVRLVISDDHPGLVNAVHEQMLGSGWQRCRVHFARNAQDLVPRVARSMVASAIRATFEQPDEARRGPGRPRAPRHPAALPGGRRAPARGRARPPRRWVSGKVKWALPPRRHVRITASEGLVVVLILAAIGIGAFVLLGRPSGSSPEAGAGAPVSVGDVESEICQLTAHLNDAQPLTVRQDSSSFDRRSTPQ